MALEHHDWITGKCRAIIGRDGNELNDWEVFIHYCNKAPICVSEWSKGKLVPACREHAERWQERGIKMRPLEELEDYGL